MRGYHGRRKHRYVHLLGYILKCPYGCSLHYDLWLRPVEDGLLSGGKVVVMKNVCASIALVLTVALLGCGGNDIDTKPDPAGSTGSGGNIGNGGSGGSGGNATCDACGEKDGTRLSRQYVVGDDGSKMTSPIWHDKDLDMNCMFQSMPNGETRCVPPHIPMNTYFDAGCTQPAFMMKSPKLECLEIPNYVRFDDCLYDTCGTITGFTIYHVDFNDDRSSNPGWRVKNPDGTCTLVGNGGVFDYKLYGVYKIGDQNKFVKAVSGVGF